MTSKKDKLEWINLINEIKKAKKDPEFMKEVRKFIRITTN